MKKILDSAKEYLNNTSKLKLASLLRMELPGSNNSGSNTYIYLTDYFRNITYNGSLYISGKLKAVSSHKQSRSLTIGSATFTITGTSNEEVLRLVRDGVSFLGLKVTIYQALIDLDGNIVPVDPDTNGPLVFFDGWITGGNIKDDKAGKGKSTITWQCANSFNDFERVAGRITDDTAHRGLEVVNGVLVPGNGAKRDEYKEDLGFVHANQSINIVATYTVQELRYKLKRKKKWWGGSSYSMQEYWEDVTKYADLDLNLVPKYLPVVYGVQNVPGIPVFADTEYDDPNTVWVVYAFCEGEIEGFLDFSFDEYPMICLDSADSNSRVCFGSKRDNGDTMQRLASGSTSSSPSTHGQEYKYNDGNGDIRIWTFHGRKDQTAAQVLVDKAASLGFKLQRDNGYGPEYWDSNYRLLDTAYAVCRFTITENRANIPEVNAELVGRKIRVYSEDGSVSTNKTSLNGAWQTLDYMINDVFGAGVPISEMNIPSFIETAKLHDILDESYDAFWVPYWRYLGWESQDQKYKSMIQMNTMLDTTDSVFKNLQALITQFSGAVNNMAGTYSLTMEKYKKPEIELEWSDTDGGVNLEDTTGRSRYNSVQASISDPAKGWKTNAITFYNSEFKVQDKNLDKKMNLQFPFITNYYTARSLAARELKKSRYNRSFSISLPYKYIGIEPNDPVAFSYHRYNWDKKYFLVEEVENTSEGKINITLQEYGEDVFVNSDQTNVGDDQLPIITNNVLPPRNFMYNPLPIADGNSENIGINGFLSWLPSLSSDILYYSIYQSGLLDPYIIEATTTSTNEVIEFPLKGLEKGMYTFVIRAINYRGFRSAPVTISVDVDPAKNLSAVPNFRVTNSIQGVSQEFYGPDILLEWDKIPEENVTVYNIQYNIEIYNLDSVLVRSVNIQNLYKYDYLLTFNKADYSRLHDTLGIHRGFTARIRAFGQNGELSVSWSNI